MGFNRKKTNEMPLLPLGWKNYLPTSSVHYRPTPNLHLPPSNGYQKVYNSFKRPTVN